MQLPSSRSLLPVFVVALSGYGSCAPCASRPAGSHDHGRTCTKWGATAYSFPPTAMLSLRSCSSSGTRSRGDHTGLHAGLWARVAVYTEDVRAGVAQDVVSMTALVSPTWCHGGEVHHPIAPPSRRPRHQACRWLHPSCQLPSTSYR
jgi:hypothetical protein